MEGGGIVVFLMIEGVYPVFDLHVDRKVFEFLFLLQVETPKKRRFQYGKNASHYHSVCELFLLTAKSRATKKNLFFDRHPPSS